MVSILSVIHPLTGLVSGLVITLLKYFFDKFHTSHWDYTVIGYDEKLNLVDTIKINANTFKPTCYQLSMIWKNGFASSTVE